MLFWDYSRIVQGMGRALTESETGEEGSLCETDEESANTESNTTFVRSLLVSRCHRASIG